MGMNQLTVEEILTTCKTVAIVGISRNPAKDSYRVADYLKNHGFQIVPINPSADEVLGEPCYPSLTALPTEVQATLSIIDVFRPSKDVPAIVRQAIQLKKQHGALKAVWMQLGITNEQAATEARQAGLTVIMDKCMLREHRRTTT